MRCLIIGYGSIGSRHARLLRAMGHDVIVVSRRDDVPYPTFSSIDAAGGEGYALAVIATPTIEHAADYLAVLRFVSARMVLLEKPVFAYPGEIPRDMPPAAETTRVGYNLRFHPLVSRTLQILEGRAVYAASLYVGQYLPDWRPGSDYRTGYSADAARGGGALRDLSHEMDLACLFAGSWRALAAIGGRVSALEMTSDDVFSLICLHERCPNVAIHMNCLDRVKQRHFTINCGGGTVQGDFVENRLTWNGVEETFDCAPDSTYERQLKAMLHEDGGPACTLGEGVDVLRMIGAAETAAREQRWVRR